MKTQIRRGVFETNSSSVHTLAITTSTDWDRFEKGELLMKDYPYDISFVDANCKKALRVEENKKQAVQKEIFAGGQRTFSE